MCQLDNCNKRGFAVDLSTGVIICAKHIQLRPKYRVMKDRVSLKNFKKYWKKSFLPIPPSKPTNNRCDCTSFEYLSTNEIKELIKI